MAWITMPGVTGKVYAPDGDCQPPGKHPCKTCFSCQWCDERRCRICMDGREAPPRRPAAGQPCPCNAKP